MYCGISLNIYQKGTSNSYTTLPDLHNTPHIHFCNKTAFVTEGPLSLTWRSSKLIMWTLDLLSSLSRKYTFGMEQLRPELHSDYFWYPQSASYTHIHTHDVSTILPFILCVHFVQSVVLYSKPVYWPNILHILAQAEIRYEVCGSSSCRSPVCAFSNISITSLASRMNWVNT